MPDLWMDVDANVIVPMNILPLLDDTDFKTVETALAYDSTGLVVYWHFVTTAGAMTSVQIHPTTGGNHDVSEPMADIGMYAIEIPASGGDHASNDTEGVGWITGKATGILPWRGPTIGFRAAGLNNALIDSAYSATRGLAGTALPDAVADAAGGLAISDAGGVDLDTVASNVATIKSDIETATTGVAARVAAIQSDIETATTGLTARVTAVQAVTAKLDTALEADAAVYRFTANALEEAPTGGAAPTVEEIADAVWDEDIVAAHTTDDTAGKLLANVEAVAGGTDWTAGEREQIRSALGVDGDKAAADTSEILAAIAALPTPGDATAANQATIIATLGTPMQAGDVSIATNGLDADSLSADAAIEIADAILKRDVDNIEATAPAHSLGTAVLKSVSLTKRSADGGTLETYRTDGATLHVSQTLTPDPAGQPVQQIGTATAP